MNEEIIYKNTSLDDIEGEMWNDVLFYDGYYQVSNFGRVKSVGRYVSNGVGGERWVKEKILKQTDDGKHELNVKLSAEGVSKTWNVTTLVANAFMRQRNENEVVCQLNKIRTDCRLSNLKIMSVGESVQIGYDKGVLKDWGIASVRHPNTSVSRRVKYEEANGIYKDGELIKIKCNKCKKVKSTSKYYKKNKSLNRTCKDCIIRGLGVKNVGKNRKEIEMAHNGYRRCSDCKEVKRLDGFGNSKRSFMGKRNICKDCANIRNAKYRQLKK